MDEKEVNDTWKAQSEEIEAVLRAWTSAISELSHQTYFIRQ
jgi:hypothetical protein